MLRASAQLFGPKCVYALLRDSFGGGILCSDGDIKIFVGIDFC